MLLRGAFSLNFYRDFMGLPATKNRPLPVGMAGFVERCIFLYLYGENSPIKSKSPRHRCVVVPSYGGSLPVAGLPIAIREDHIVQITRDELVQHRTYHAPFLFAFYTCIICLPFPFCKLQIRRISQFRALSFWQFAQCLLRFLVGYIII